MDAVDSAAGKLRDLRLSAAVILAASLAACGHFRAAAALHDPLSADEHLRLGAAYDQQGLAEEALRQYKLAANLQPQSASGWMALGNREFLSGNYDSAESAFRKVLRLAPDHPGANNNLATVFLERGKNLEEAERLALTALGQDSPLKPYILDTVAKIYLQQRRFAEAGRALDEAEASSPPNDPSFLDRLRETRRGLEKGG